MLPQYPVRHPVIDETPIDAKTITTTRPSIWSWILTLFFCRAIFPFNLLCLSCFRVTETVVVDHTIVGAESFV